ncbi:nuclear body protein SP140-like protein isoform 1-T2 [Glossophaga mutica]
MCCFTLAEFAIRRNHKTGDWKKLRCGGRTLDDLMKDGTLPDPSRKHGANKRGADSDKCKICQDGGKLSRCEKCRSLFHAGCHIPPVDPEKIARTHWNCTFCTVENSSQSQQRHRESEVLEKQMGPEEKLKCEFLLLKVYSHLEGNVFPNIPYENYVEEASRCLEKLRKLDTIKDSLIKGAYSSVGSFVQAMDNFFTLLECSVAEFTKDNFKKNFKDIFAIQETN